MQVFKYFNDNHIKHLENLFRNNPNFISLEVDISKLSNGEFLSPLL